LSSKRHIRRKACGSKVRHATHAAAVKHIRSLKTLTPMNAYKCEFCHGFHVGHKPGASAVNQGRRA
jgi:hypothetical protein